MAGIRRVFGVHSLDPATLSDDARLTELLNDSNCERTLKARDGGSGYGYLHLAARDNSLQDAARRLLSRGADPNACSSKQTDEQTPLHIAAKSGNEAVLHRLLDDPRSDITILDSTGASPMDYAIRIKSVTTSNKLDIVWRQNSERQEAFLGTLSDAIRTGQLEAILPLVNREEKKNLIRFQSHKGEVVLRSESLLNSLPLVRWVGHDPAPLPATLPGCSVVHLACQHGRADILFHFLHLIPDILSCTSNEGYAPLHVLAMNNQVALLQQLLDIIRVQKMQSLSLSESTQPQPMTTGSDTVVMVAKETINVGEVNFDVQTHTKHTPLHLAAALGHVEFVDLLLSNAKHLDLDVNASDVLGLTPLHLVVKVMPSNEDTERMMRVIHLLLKFGVNVNTNSLQPDGDVLASPLTQALGARNYDLVQLLGRHGARDTKRTAINLCLEWGLPLEVLTDLLARVVQFREGKCSVTWQHVKFPGNLPAEWMANALVSAHCYHHGLREMRSSVLPAIEASVTVMDLSYCHLKELPLEVFLFPNLSSLSARSNSLETLPTRGRGQAGGGASLLQSGWRCLNLRSLQLAANHLRTLPECLFQLPQLEKLSVAHNSITELPSNMWIASQLKEFDCSYNALTWLPGNSELVLSRSVVEEQSTVVESVKQGHHELFLIQSQQRLVEAEPTDPAHLVKEVELYLDPDFTKSRRQRLLRPQVGVVKSLSEKLEERLMVHHPDLVFLSDPSGSDSFAHQGLQHLILHHNQLGGLPPDFPCLCPRLKELDLAGNLIRSLSLPYIFPDSLCKLNLTGNPLTTFNCCQETPPNHFCTTPQAASETRPPGPGPSPSDGPYHCSAHGSQRLPHLATLRLEDCGLVGVNFYSSTATSTAAELSFEDLQDHRFDADTQVEVVGGKITNLNLSRNLLKEVHSSIVHLKQLESLYISHNPDIIQVPKDLGRLRKLQEIHFEGLNLINPPMELLGKANKSRDIIGYLSSLYLKAHPYHRLKLMLVGREGRGKTSLLDRLMEKGTKTLERNVFIRRAGQTSKQSQRLSTVGISLRDWTYKRTSGAIYNGIDEIIFRTWDFGGQGEFYATHQIFLTAKSLYLAVWDVTHGRKGAEELKMWLLNIHARVSRAAVIIVGTHVDRVPREHQPILESLLEEMHRFYHAGRYQPGALNKGRSQLPPQGFPQVLAIVTASSVTKHGIAQLRDIIYEAATSIKEGGSDESGPIANRARYVLTQLYPASYLWLEDKVRSLVMDYRDRGRPPVLTTKEFMSEIGRDENNMFTGDTAKEDLEKAVRFLSAGGTLVHQDDPLLADLYFIDPQWLCDMFAHVITIRDVNAFIQNGIVLRKNLDQVFRDDVFPIKWKKEYIRLMTIFEVVVEIDGSQLLVPSHVKDEDLEDPFLSLQGGLHCLPPLHHFFLFPHIPSGFWVRFISRMLGDLTVVALITAGFGTKKVKNFFGRDLPFSWHVVQRGISLHYEDFPVLTVRELPGRQIFQIPNCRVAHYLHDGPIQPLQWTEFDNRNNSGIEVVINDLYPLLVLEEVKYSYQKRDMEALSQFSFIEFAALPSNNLTPRPPSPLTHSCPSFRPQSMSSVPPPPTLTLPRVATSNGQGLLTEVDITRNPRVRMKTRRSKRGTLTSVVVQEQPSGQPEPLAQTDRLDIIEEGTDFSQSQSRGRVPPQNDMFLSTTVKIPLNKAKRALSKREQLKQSLRRHNTASDSASHATPTLREDVYDAKRAALLSLVLDHIRSIWEDWYPRLRTGRVPKGEDERVPCPFCWEDRPSGPQKMKRSFTGRPDLDDEVKLMVYPSGECEFLTPHAPPSSPSPGQPNNGEVPADLLCDDSPSWDTPNHYLFNYYYYLEVCPSPAVCHCPRHHIMPSQYVIPNMTFQSVTCEIVPDKDLQLVTEISAGNFATVEKRLWKRKTGKVIEVAVKLMKCSGQRSNYHIMLEKELSIMNDLDHPNIIRCLGVILMPLAAILELAPLGSLRGIYLEYKNEDLLIPLRVVHKTLLDVTNALHYLHSKKVIYHDLKADNVLVWQYVLPGHQLAAGDSSILGDEVVKVKLADFNISSVVPLVQKIHYAKGTSGFIAPELVNHKQGLFSHKVDIFSLGSFIYELLVCQVPFDKDPGQFYKGLRPPLFKKHRVFPILLLEVMYWCWDQRVDVRPSAEEVLRALASDQCLRLLSGVDLHDKMLPRALALWWGKPCNQPQLEPPMARTAPSPTIEVRNDSQPESPPPATPPPARTTPPPARPPSRATPTPVRTPPPAVDRPLHRLWVASGDFFSSCLTVLDYRQGQFEGVQDISSGASSVLCIAVVDQWVWVGFEHGYLMVYHCPSKCPVAQLWPRGRAQVVQVIAHVPERSSVYLGFGNGFVWSVPDDTVAVNTVSMVSRPLSPTKEFEDLKKTVSSMLVVPGGGANQCELWVGQNERSIAILSLPSLELKEYLSIDEQIDQSSLPCYLSDVYVGHLVLEELEPDQGGCRDNSFLYTALLLGQVVIRWSVSNRKRWTSYNITSCEELSKINPRKLGVWISSLHSNSRHVYIGLTTGDIIILQTGTLTELSVLSCHSQQVKCLITMPTPPVAVDSEDRQQLDHQGLDHAHSFRLVSCGLGFKSYYAPKPVDPTHKSLPQALEPAKLLLWNVSHI